MVATFALLVSNGLKIRGMPHLYSSTRKEFVAVGPIDESVAESFIANEANITSLMSVVFSLIGGWFTVRFGLKRLMVVSYVMLGYGLAMHLQVQSAEFRPNF